MALWGEKYSLWDRPLWGRRIPLILARFRCKTSSEQAGGIAAIRQLAEDWGAGWLAGDAVVSSHKEI